jgi:hypothetical protein
VAAARDRGGAWMGEDALAGVRLRPFASLMGPPVGWLARATNVRWSPFSWLAGRMGGSGGAAPHQARARRARARRAKVASGTSTSSDRRPTRRGCGPSAVSRHPRAKTAGAGRRVVAVPLAFTSQEYSGRGERTPQSLSVRTHVYTSRRLALDRVETAARNI